MTPAEREAIADEAKRIAAAMDAEAGAGFEELLAMSLEELLALYAERGIEIDDELLTDRIELMLGRDVLALDRGVVLDEARMERLESQVGKAIERAAKTVARDVIRQTTQTALLEADERDEDQRFGVWISVADENVCPTCESRHGTVFRLDYWEDIMPGSASSGTLCEEHCRCRIYPCSAPPSGSEGLRFEEFR